MTKKPTLVERIKATVQAHGGRMRFRDLADALYPDPLSHRYKTGGGPPGCYMALSAACRRGGFYSTWTDDGHRWVSVPFTPETPQ